MTPKRKEFFARLNMIDWCMEGLDTKADWDLQTDERILLEKGYINLRTLHAIFEGKMKKLEEVENVNRNNEL